MSKERAGDEPNVRDLQPEDRLMKSIFEHRFVRLDDSIYDFGATISPEAQIERNDIVAKAFDRYVVVGESDRVDRERDLRILKLRHGFDDGEPLTRIEIGTEIGVTAERVRQLENRVMRKMRHPTYSNSLLPFAPYSDDFAVRRAWGVSCEHDIVRMFGEGSMTIPADLESTLLGEIILDDLALSDEFIKEYSPVGEESIGEVSIVSLIRGDLIFPLTAEGELVDALKSLPPGTRG